MAKPIDESTISGALASGKGGGVGGSSRLHLGTITTASLPIDDCQAETARARVRALGFMAEATLVKAKLSTGQHISKHGYHRNHAARSVMPKLALVHKAHCGYQLMERSEWVGARHVSQDEPNNYK